MYLLNVFIPFKKVSYIKLIFVLKINHKICAVKKLKKFGKPVRKIEKNEWQPWLHYKKKNV